MTTAAAVNTAAQQKTTVGTVEAAQDNYHPTLDGLTAEQKKIAASFTAWMQHDDLKKKTRTTGPKKGTQYRPQSRRRVKGCSSLWLIATSANETQPEMIGLELNPGTRTNGAGEPASRGFVLRSMADANALISGLQLNDEIATKIRDRVAVIERFNPVASGPDADDDGAI